MTATQPHSTDTRTQLTIMGVPVESTLALEIAARLRDEAIYDIAEAIEIALMHGYSIVRLTPDDRAAILSVLKDPPAELVPLRDVLLNEHAKRMRDVGGPYRDYPTA